MTLPTPASNAIDPLRAAGVLVRLTRMLDQHLRALEREDGLSLAEMGVLGEISRGTHLPSAIARAARLDPARVTRVVERLVTLGLVTREAGTRDRRQSLLALTPAGATRLEQGRTDLREAMAVLLDALTPQQRTALAVALDGVQAVLTRDQ
jgi:DNA-binding MarR family transcriptional regulator